MAVTGVETQATKRLGFSTLSVGNTLKGSHISGTIKQLWPVSDLSRSFVSGERWGSASRVLRMVLEDFTVSSSTELSISCYDRWADRLGELVSTGDLLHICGTGAIVAENAAKSLPSDHDGRLVLAESSILDSLQPDTQQGGMTEGYTQMAAFQPLSQSAAFDTQPSAQDTASRPVPSPRPPATAELTISVRVQKALPSTSASMYKQKTAFGPAHKVTSASLHQVSTPPRPLAAPLRRTKTDGTVHQLHRSRTAPASSTAASIAASPPVSPGALSAHSAGEAASPAHSPGGEYGQLVKQLMDTAPPSHRKRYRRLSGKLDFLRMVCSQSKVARVDSGSEDSGSESSSGGSGGGRSSEKDSGNEEAASSLPLIPAASPQSDDGYSSEASCTVQEMLQKLPQGRGDAAPTGPAWIMASQMQSMAEDEHSLELPSSAAPAPATSAATQSTAHSASAQASQPHGQEADLSASAQASQPHGQAADLSASLAVSSEDSGAAAESGVFDASTMLGEPDAQFDYTSDSQRAQDTQGGGNSPRPHNALEESITPSLSSVDHTPATVPAAPRVGLRGPVGALQLEIAPPQTARSPPSRTVQQPPRRVSFGSSAGNSRASFVRNLSSAGLSAGSRPLVQGGDEGPSGDRSGRKGTAQDGDSTAERADDANDEQVGDVLLEPESAGAEAVPVPPAAEPAAAAAAVQEPDTSLAPKWNELAARSSAGAAKGGGGKYSYRHLDSLPVQQRVNVYGVVLDCSLPTATKGSDFKSKLVLLDETRSNITQAAVVHSFLKQDKHLIPHQAGDVLRLHRVKIVDFQGQEQIQLNNPERVSGGRPSGMIFRRDGSFSATSNNFTLTAADTARIRVLMDWGDCLLRENILYSSPYSIDMQHTVTAPGQGGSHLDGYKDCLVCIAAIFVNGVRQEGGLNEQAGQGGAAVQFVVWDGTGPGGACATYLPEGHARASFYPADAGGRNLGALVFVDVSPQAAVVSHMGLRVGDWARMRNLSPFLLKQGCFPGGVVIPEPDSANQAVLYGLRLHQGGVVKVPALCKDVQSKLSSYKSLASEAVQEEIRQLQYGIHPKFSISSGNDLAPVTPIADAVQCQYAPSKYRVQGVVVGHWPANIVDCISTPPGGRPQYSFVLRLARNARDPVHMDLHVFGEPAAKLMSHVAPCDLLENEHALNVLQRIWEFIYSLPVDVIVLAQQAQGSAEGQPVFSLLSAQLNYVGQTG